MSNITTTDLPAAVGLTGTEEVAIVQSGTSKRTTAQDIANLNNNAGTVTSIATALPITGGTITTTGTIALQSASIDNTYLSSMPANTLKGNNTASTAQPVDMTVNQAMTMLGAAPLASPTFTGTPRAPTPATGDNSTIIATTAYVKAQGYGGGSVTSVATGTGLTGGPITSTGTISIANTGVTASSYGSGQVVPNIAVNSQGQITSASNVPISITPSQVVGLGTMAVQDANSVAITGGTINGTTIGATTPAAGSFTALTATGTTNLNTIASGTWNGTAIGVAYGGTGATTASVARSNLGAAASGANSDITSLSGLTTPLSAPQGGTGFGSFTTGDLLYADTSSTLARLNDVATGNALISGGVGVAPSWGKIDLATHVSGTLPVANGGSGAATLTGFLKGNGTSPFTAQATINNADLTNSSVTVGSTTVSLGGTASTISGLTTLTLTQDPTSALQASTKQYVDGQVASVSNTTFHTQSGYATTADLGTVNYSNGTGGVGATITNAGTQAVLTIDGYTFTATDVTNATRVLVKNQSSGLQNGIYVVTNQGSISTNWQLTRATDFDTVGTGPNYIETGASTFVTGGAVNGSTGWVMNTTGTINVGSTALNWVQSSSSASVTVTSPLTKVGSVISLGTVTVPYGGTGLTSLTQYGVMLGNGTGNVNFASPSTSGYALLSNGASANPSFGQLSLTTGVTGTLPVANGGTGTSTAFTQGSIVFAGASGTYSQNNADLFWDNTNIRLGINTPSPNTNLTIVSNTQTATPVSAGALPAGTDLYILGADAANTRITQDAYGTGNYPAYTGRQARGTAASPTASQTGDILAQYTGRGYGATAFASSSNARIDMEAAENFTDTAQGTYISMHTTALGAASPTEKFRVGPSGQWGIGGGTYGTSGYAFVSGGASAAPSWSQISLTAGVTGTLPATNGGTGQSSYTTGDLLYASSSSALSRLADVATGNVLLSGGVGVAPSWGKVDLTTAVNGTLPVTNGGTGQASALTQYGVVYGSTTSAMATTAAGTTGQVLIATTGGAPSWSSTIPSGAGVTSFSAGTTGLTPSSATTGAVTLAGTLATGNGGTGLTGFTSGGAVYATSTTALTTGTLPATAGGTGFASYAVGDLLYASTTTALSKLADVATGSVLVSGGVGVAPAWSASPTVTSLTTGSISDSGNLTFTGTGNRITGDFNNATVANRVMFQTSTANAATRVEAIPNGTGTTCNFAVYNNSDPTNASATRLTATSSDSRVESVITGTGSYLPMTFYTGGSERMRIDTSGNVGIGTSSPGYRLDVQGSSATLNLQSTTTTNLSYLTLRNIGYNYVGVENSAGGGLFTGSSAYALALGTVSAYPIQFATNGTVRATIDSSGNVGIGTSSPNTKFVVSNGGAAGLEINPTGFSSAPSIVSYNRSGAAYTQLTLDGASNVFAISGTERMRIDSSGNVGIGTSSPGYKLDVQGSASGAFSINIQNTNTGSNAQARTLYTSSTNTFIVGSTNDSFYGAGGILYNGSAVPITFYTNATERMRIDSSGNLLVGTTSATSGALLTVNGGIADSIGNVRSIPQNSQTTAYVLVASDNGKHISITTGGVTVPASVFSAGQVVSVYNNSGSSQTITQGATVTMRQAGTANTGNRTLAQYGLCTILCVASNTFVISGSGLS